MSACSSDKKSVSVSSPGTTAASAGSTATTGATATTAATATTGAGSSTTTAGATGGTITIGVEQEWDCMDWMGSCGGSTYGAWSALFATTTRPFDFVQDADGIWKYKASNLLTGEPALTTVGGKQTVTYKINPKAVWSDGQPITSTDLKYTWTQVTTGSDIYDTSVFRDVESIDDSDPSTAVLTFSKQNASWKDLYESYGIYPAHLLEGKDRNAETKDGYTWSAGPFKLEKWDKGVGASLVRNDAYWGDKAKVDRVEEKFFADTAAEFQAFKAGEVDVIGPQPQLDAIDAINAGGLPGKSVVSAVTGNVEALWLNNAKAPFDSKIVRQAFAYAIDRDAIVNKLFGGIGVNKAVNSLNPPILAEFSDQAAFAGYKLDLGKVDSLLTGDGWAKGSDGIYAKAGQKLSFEMKTTSGNKRRELTVQVLQQQLKTAGFDMTINEQKSSDLFGQQLPPGDFQAALYAQTATTLSPGLTSTQSSKSIPGPANNNSGQNWTRTNVPGVDALLDTVDTETDDAKRAAAAKAADKLLAADMVTLPLDPLPNLGFYGDKISGDFSINVIAGPWWNIASWTVNS
ncbi:MAG: ABC-type dipeptide transport system, periplasmic component [Ilumatobacteraceae bacterium]|nr:ABC-type dipeptide transport system, periplasmic component [Ilumatobacteraceae bacterium]